MNMRIAGGISSFMVSGAAISGTAHGRHMNEKSTKLAAGRAISLKKFTIPVDMKAPDRLRGDLPRLNP